MVSMSLAMHLTHGFPALISYGKLDGGPDGKPGRQTVRSNPLDYLTRTLMPKPGTEVLLAGGMTS